MPSYNLDLKPLGPCNSEPLKKLKSSRLQMFFENSIKHFAIFTGKHLCRESFFNKVARLKVCNFLQIYSNTDVSYGYCSSLKEHLRWLLLTALP